MWSVVSRLWTLLRVKSVGNRHVVDEGLRRLCVRRSLDKWSQEFVTFYTTLVFPMMHS
jgi:hypothetical protein